jgi:simple sugar transport system permease protein
VAVGFVLALMGRDLAYFLGAPFNGLSGPFVNELPIPLLKDIPVLGPLFFQQNILVYMSYLLIIGAAFYMYKTRPGLTLVGIGERPAAAYVRGADVNKLRYLYAVLGGALVGVAGPMYSLAVKAGWKGTISGLDGIGWIALSITIFGGWNPIKGAFGSYFFVLLQWLGLVLQAQLTNIPSQVLQVAPFPLMIMALLFVNIGNAEWVDRTLAAMPDSTRKVVSRILRAMRTSPPASLAVPFEKD